MSVLKAGLLGSRKVASSVRVESQSITRNGGCMSSRKAGLVALLAAVLGLAVSASAPGASPSCESRPNNTFDKLLDCVTLDGARAHQAALQAIATANNGSRQSGTPGFDESVDYAVDVFEDAGLNVTVQPFSFVAFTVLAPTVLEQVAPGPVTTLPNVIMSYSGSGDVTAAVTALPAPPGDA